MGCRIVGVGCCFVLFLGTSPEQRLWDGYTVAMIDCVVWRFCQIMERFGLKKEFYYRDTMVMTIIINAIRYP
jgi:hypothetical protein